MSLPTTIEPANLDDLLGALKERQEAGHPTVIRELPGSTGFLDLHSWEWYRVAKPRKIGSLKKRRSLFGDVDVSRSRDGRTTWVNAPWCIARHCPLSGEVLDKDRHLETVPGESWDDWAKRVSETFQEPVTSLLLKHKVK